MKKKIELDFEAPTKIRGLFLFLHMLWPHKYYQETMARETQFQCWEPYDRQRSEKRIILDYCNCYYHWIFHSAGFLCQQEKASN
jgi:hypothetical protein